MDTFGERLRHEREDRGLSIEAVSERIGTDEHRLAALERNDFSSLPDNEPVMIDTLRAYAECLGVESDLMIEDYARERERVLQTLDDAVTAQAGVEISPSAGHPLAGRPSHFQRPLVVAGILVVGLVFGTWGMWSGDGVETPPATTAEPVSEPPAPRSAPTAAADQPPLTTPVEAELARRLEPVAPKSSGASITNYGVGTGVKGRQLIGEGNRFDKGAEVWFWTRVDNGNPGDRVEHVWFHEGVVAATVSLKLGGSRWRTYSAKTLRSAGAWTVEARDASGHVLARSQFVCSD